jgi:hypothetical protein
MQVYQSTTAKIYNTAVQGALVRVPWSSIHLAENLWDWSEVDRQVAQIKNGMSYNMAIYAGPHIPEWVKARAGRPLIEYDWRGEPRTTMNYYDMEWFNYSQVLARAVASRYGDDARFNAYYVPQCTLNGVEGNYVASVLPDGWNSSTLAGSVALVAMFAASALEKVGNTHTKVCVEVHDANKTQEWVKLLSDFMKNNSRYRLGVWWLGKGDYQKDLQALIRESGIPVLAQTIAAYSRKPNRIRDYNGDQAGFEFIKTQAEDLGAELIEYWQADTRLL